MNMSLTYSNNDVPATSVPFPLQSISVSIGIVAFDAGKDSFSVSEVEVLMNALAAYKNQVKDFVDNEERTAIFNTIADLKGSIEQEMYKRLSESATMLHQYQRGQQSEETPESRRASK